jgi:hypothetical protein
VNDAIAGAWTGGSSQAFNTLHGSWIKRLEVIGHDLPKIATFLRAAADEYRKRDAERNTAMFSTHTGQGGGHGSAGLPPRASAPGHYRDAPSGQGGSGTNFKDMSAQYGPRVGRVTPSSMGGVTYVRFPDYYSDEEGGPPPNTWVNLVELARRIYETTGVDPRVPAGTLTMSAAVNQYERGAMVETITISNLPDPSGQSVTYLPDTVTISNGQRSITVPASRGFMDTNGVGPGSSTSFPVGVPAGFANGQPIRVTVNGRLMTGTELQPVQSFTMVIHPPTR